MRAREPDLRGWVTRDGVRLGYEVFGEGDQTILLLPTWTIIHSRFWKMQVAYLARHHRVITYDGPGNGRSDRVTDPTRYSAESYAADAKTVMGQVGVDRVVVVGLSLGAQYGVRLASLHPESVSGLVLVGPAIPLVPPERERADTADLFTMPYPENPQGWEKYNLAYWHDHYEDFTEFFFSQCFSEPHSTKPQEDSVFWASQTGPDILEAEANRPELSDDGSRRTIDSRAEAIAHWSLRLEGLDCPVMVVHGTGDRIQPFAAGMEAARLTGGRFVSMEGSGHIPNVRDPVRFNLALHEFVEGLTA